MDPFDLLPDELILVQALRLDLPSVSRLCQTSQRFNRVICDNELYWRQKFVRDYNFSPQLYRGSWKVLYREYNAVWTFGANISSLEDEDKDNYQSSPTQLPNFKARQVSAGGFHTIVIDLNGNVWSSGMNGSGQLGLGDLRRRSILTQIELSSIALPHGPNFKVKQISAGTLHTMMIDPDDTVWSFGENVFSQLGLGDQRDRSSPTQIPNLKAKQVSAGAYHTVVIDLDDSAPVWTFGWNNYGQLGLGNDVGRSRPTLIPNLKAKQVSAGRDHTVVIDLDDNVWAFGLNEKGQLGLGHTQDRTTPTLIEHLKAKQASAGGYHTIVIDLDDSVWAFGNNRSGQLGLGDNLNRATPTLIPNLKAKQVSNGEWHTVVIDLDSNVWSFGGNNEGQLGLGDNRDRSTPTLIPNLKAQQVSAGSFHTIVIGTIIF